MIEAAQYAGWVITLLAVSWLVSLATKGLISLVLSEAREGREASAEDVMRSLTTSLALFVKLLAKRWLGTLAAGLVIVLLRGNRHVDMYATLGFSIACFAIVGLATPAILAKLRPLASKLGLNLRNTNS